MSMYFRLVVISIFIFLAGCAGVQKSGSDKYGASNLVPFSPPALDLDASLTELNNLRQQAAGVKNWVEYILLTEELWLQSQAHQREAIEQDAWITLQAVTLEDEAVLLNASQRVVQQWGWLLEARKERGLNFTRTLEDIRELAPSASFNTHLIPQLIAFYEALVDNRTLALLLPFSGEYASVSNQIKNGFLKAYWHSQKSHKLLFIDTHDFSDTLAAYQQAKRWGADLVLGPLTPAELYQLHNQGITDLIALNSLEQDTSFMQFSLRSQTEAQQLVEEINCQGYKQVGVLSSDSLSQVRFKQKLDKVWLEYHPYLPSTHIYSDRNPNLRQEMAYLINATFSQERASFLSRALESPIEFFPRTREDLDAIILLGDEKQLSVLRPQFEYFDLSLPIYATSNLNTDNLARTKINRDLKQIIFPATPIALERSPLNTNLEALGWDAFYLGMYQPLLAEGLHFNGSLGQHQILHNNRIATQLIWAKFQDNGSLQPLYPDKYSRLGLSSSAEDEEVRKLLLEDIIQLPLQDLEDGRQ